jgi:hypothetical protein
MKAGLKPRVLPSLLIALADGRPRCDRELMDIVFSNRRVVQRRLQQLHVQSQDVVMSTRCEQSLSFPHHWVLIHLIQCLLRHQG